MSGEWIFARDERARIDLSKFDDIPDNPMTRTYAEEARRLFADPDVRVVGEPLTAAADVASGAMVALVPQQSDLERLAVEGGEPLDQLHLTLLYLGEADQIDPEIRTGLIDAGRDMVQGWNGVAGEAFAPALFNPTGPEPCAVILCSGDELAEFYETALADVTELVDLPEDLHRPWCAHITLAYWVDQTATVPMKGGGTMNVAHGIEGRTAFDLVVMAGERMGPVLFDRLRFAFAGEVTDIPIATTEAPPVLAEGPDPVEATTAETPAAEDSPVVAPEPAVVASGRAEFDGCLRCYGPAHAGDCPPARRARMITAKRIGLSGRG